MEYDDRQESWQKPVQIEEEVRSVLRSIKDQSLDLPKRTAILTDDDILNVRIALESSHTIDELIAQL
jgi:hypothetical protein